MSRNPILKVLSTFRKCDVKALLMGGQACILYGASEFSRDTDFVVLCSDENLERLKAALKALDAEQIFFPPLEKVFLQRGHACHFRCGHPDLNGFRVDIMSVMRGCDDFDQLWARRTLIDLPDIPGVGVLSLPDLVAAKKTQRDKDWPMIRRLIEADYERHKADPSDEKIRFWLQECQTPELLYRLARQYPDIIEQEQKKRPLLTFAVQENEDRLFRQLLEEQHHQRHLDKAYWAPLRKELESMRSERRDDS